MTLNMSTEDPNKYKITISDVLRGIASLAICFLVFIFLSDSIGNKLKESASGLSSYIYNLHPFAWIIFIILVLFVYSILGGFMKAIECGFSPWILLKKFRKK